MFNVSPMIWSGREVAKFIRNCSEEQIQPNGVDLTLGWVYAFSGLGTIDDGKTIPKYDEILPNSEGVYILKPGAYLVRYQEIVKIPTNAIGLVFPRSSLQRMGAIVYTSVWDSGYQGRGIGLMVVYNPYGIRIKRGSRICQIIFVTAKSYGEYMGSYQCEGLSL